MQLYHAPKAVNPERTYNFLKAKGKLDAVEIVEIFVAPAIWDKLLKLAHKSYVPASAASRARGPARAST